MGGALLLAADIHFGDEDQAALKALDAALPDIDPAIIVVAGDETIAGRRSELKAAAAWLRHFERPIVLTPGNHDVPYYNPLKRILLPFRRYDDLLSSAGETHYEDDDFAIVAVTSARGPQARMNWAQGSISRKQARAAAEAVAAAPPSALRIIVCHHPLIQPSVFPFDLRTHGGGAAATILAEGGVDLVLSGHLHVPFVEPLPGGDGRTIGIGAGTLSNRTRGAPPGFTTITSTDGCVETTIWSCVDGVAKPSEPVRLNLRPRADRAV